MEIDFKDWVLFKLNFEDTMKNLLIQRKNINMEFLRKQGRQLFKLKLPFCFAYHPLRSDLAPDLGYIVEKDTQLLKIRTIKGEKGLVPKNIPTVLFNVVYDKDKHAYGSTNPFSEKRNVSKSPRNREEFDPNSFEESKDFRYTFIRLDSIKRDFTIDPEGKCARLTPQSSRSGSAKCCRTTRCASSCSRSKSARRRRSSTTRSRTTSVRAPR